LELLFADIGELRARARHAGPLRSTVAHGARRARRGRDRGLLADCGV